VSTKVISHAASDIGKHRSSNQDSGYAGYQLYFVADGMGGHAGGDIASAIASQRIALTDARYDSIDEAIETIKSGILEANSMLAATVAEHPELEGMGTTFSGILVQGNQVLTAHIGDSRIYLVRDGAVKQLSTDHTFVQRLVEMGRITPEEALVHPRRSVLMRVLGDVVGEPEIDVALFDAVAGDRWMICSDGLSGVVPEELMSRILTSKISPSEAADLLVGEALEFGAPDNVTVVVADIVRSSVETDFEPSARFVGSGANEVVIAESRGSKILQLLNPLTLLELLKSPEDPTEYQPESEEALAKILAETKRKIRWRGFRSIFGWFLIALAAVGVGYLAYSYTQTRFYVAEFEGQVTIFQGIKEELGPLKFSQPYQVSDISIDELSPFQQELISRSISANSLEDAERILSQLEESLGE
jgi:serine/threonine protein phosphatase PrpC